MKRLGTVFALALSVSLPAHADLVLKESVVRETGDQKSSEERVVFISGTKMRVDEEGLDSTLYDAASGRILAWDPAQGVIREAGGSPRGPEPFTSQWTAGEPGQGCQLYKFGIQVAIGKRNETLLITGTATITPDDAQDYIAFQKAAAATPMMLLSPEDGLVEDPDVARAFARGRTEVNRRIAESGGRPCVIDLSYTRARTGFWRFLDKTFSGSLHLEVKAVATDPFPRETLEAPEGRRRLRDDLWPAQVQNEDLGRIHVLGRHLWLGLGVGVSSLAPSASKREFGAVGVSPVVRFVGPPSPKGIFVSIDPVYKTFSNGHGTAWLVAPTGGVSVIFAKPTSDVIPIGSLKAGAFFVSHTGGLTYLRPGADAGLGIAFKKRLAVGGSYERVVPARGLDLSNWSWNVIVRAF